MPALISDAEARTLALYWHDEQDLQSPISQLARTGAIAGIAEQSLRQDLHVLRLTTTGVDGGAPTVAQAQLEALLAYVIAHGPRPAVDGWDRVPLTPRPEGLRTRRLHQQSPESADPAEPPSLRAPSRRPPPDPAEDSFGAAPALRSPGRPAAVDDVGPALADTVRRPPVVETDDDDWNAPTSGGWGAPVTGAAEPADWDDDDEDEDEDWDVPAPARPVSNGAVRRHDETGAWEEEEAEARAWSGGSRTPASPPRPAPPAGPHSPLDLIGGTQGLIAAVDDLYRRMLADPALSPYFRGVDLDRLRAHQHALLRAALGGPQNYGGRRLGEVHGPLNLSDWEFDRMLAHLVEALAERGMPRAAIADLVGRRFAPLRADVVSY